jgi:quercetin dioxygenase-like cupin family protein
MPMCGRWTHAAPSAGHILQAGLALGESVRANCAHLVRILVNVMSARSVSWDNGPTIPGTVFRHLIAADDTGGRFSAQSAVLAPRELVIPHSHEREDEFTFVYRGRIGGLVGKEEAEVDEGGFLFKPRGIVHALWNPTDEPVVVVEFISPAGFEHFFEEMGALTDAEPRTVQEIAERYGQRPHPELISGLQERHHIHL